MGFTEKKIVKRPQKLAFAKAILIDKWIQRISIGSFLFTVSVTIVKSLNFTTDIYNSLMFISIILTITISVLTILFNYLKTDAETERRKGLIENSFDLKIAQSASENYYDTDNINYGPKKLLATIHENCMYTRRISEKMIKKCSVKLLGMSIVLLICFFIGIAKVEIFDSILQLFLSGIFLYEFIEILTLHLTTKKLEEESIIIWSTYNGEINNAFLAKAIEISIKYECAITRANLILDEAIYKKYNAEIETEWLEFRKRHSIFDENIN